MRDDERPDIAHELRVAADALDSVDPAHAVRHIGAALRLDPASTGARALAARLADRPGGGLDLLPEDGDTAEDAAVRTLLLVRAGRVTEAVGTVLALVLAVPEVPYALLALDWLPGAAADVDPGVIPAFCKHWIDAYPEGIEDPAVRLSAEPLIELLTVLLAAHPGDMLAHTAASAVPRRLSRGDIAVAWTEHAFAVEPSAMAAIMLAYALREEDRDGEAEAVFRKAIDLSDDLETTALVRTDLAELLCDTGRATEGLAQLAVVLEAEPAHERAFPVACYRRWQLDGDPDHVGALMNYLDRHPDSTYGRELADWLGGHHPWVCAIPEPVGATVGALGRVVAEHLGGAPPGPDGLELQLTNSLIDSPSALLSVAMLTRSRLGERVTVQAVQEPDPRLPRRPVRHLLWRYDDKLPRPAVRAPRPATVAAAARLATGAYFPPRYRLDRAWSLLAAAGPGPVPELLGVMAFPPAPPPELAAAPWRWTLRVQTLAALAVALMEQSWDGSARREVLLDLADGPEDWTVDAALAALAWIADTTPAARPEILSLFCRRVSGLAGARVAGAGEPQSGATACVLALGFPDLDPAVAAAARTWLGVEQP